MTIEAVQYISDLNVSFPRSTDLLKEGDDHIRMIKNALKRTFPSIMGVVQISHTKLNALDTGMDATATAITFKLPVTVNSEATVRDTFRAGSIISNSSINGRTVELSDASPYIDFHFNNGANDNANGDYNVRIINDVNHQLRLGAGNGPINLAVGGTINADGNITGGGLISTGAARINGDMNANSITCNGSANLRWAHVNADTPTNEQGMYLGWSSPAYALGRGVIKVNEGTGDGGIAFEFIRGSGRTGYAQFYRDGKLDTNGISSRTDIHTSGDVFAGVAHLGQDGNIYHDGNNWASTGHNNLLSYLNDSNEFIRALGGRIKGWSGVGNSQIATIVDGVQLWIDVKGTSDERLKEKIEDQNSEIGYNRINAIPLKKFKWKKGVLASDDPDAEGKECDMGFMAQDVEKIIPEAIEISKSHFEDSRLINQQPLINNLIAAVQHLSKKVESLEAKLAKE